MTAGSALAIAGTSVTSKAARHEVCVRLNERTYAEFGRRPRENLSLGTDHGTANVQFAFGGTVHGGMYGAPPSLDHLDGNGNVAHAIDFRSVYATVLETWWGVPATSALGGSFRPLPLVNA